MGNRKQKVAGRPAWANKGWWVVLDEGILLEHIKVLIGIKRNIPNVSARIHEVATIIALRHLTPMVLPGGRLLEEDVNPKPRKGPDIRVRGVTSDGEGRTFEAEVVTNFSFEKGPQAEKLRNDARRLISSRADRKFLVVLFERLVQDVKDRCRRRRRDAVDLDDQGIEVLSIEKMIESTL